MASRSVPATFNGMACPDSCNLGFTHGTAAAQATVKVLGNYSQAPLGTPGTIQVGNSTFNGFLVNTEFTWNDQSTTFRYVDWRDRLHDQLLFAAFNMQEDDGRFYHIFPDDWSNHASEDAKKKGEDDTSSDLQGNDGSDDWSTQRKTYVTREVIQTDFASSTKIKSSKIFNRSIGTNRLYTAFDLLNWVGFAYQFQMVAEKSALKIMNQCVPMNMDANQGMQLAEFVNAILEKANMQYTALPTGVLYVTIRGYSESAFSNALANGFLNPCSTGSDSPSIGQELGERGRRVKVVGDHNKYEWIFLCQQNWNPAWTWNFAYDGAKLSALLKKNSLTRLSKLKEMPEAYRDSQTWSDAENLGEGSLTEKRTRNEMTIQEYLDKIVYKAYVVDFTTVATINTVISDKYEGKRYKFDPEKDTDETVVEEGKEKEIKKYSYSDKWNDEKINSVYPLSKSLVTDSELQFLCYAASRKIIRGAKDPFSGQFSFVPKNGGASLDVEERLDNVKTGRTTYRVRLFFNQPQFWVRTDLDQFHPNRIEPDRIAVRLSLDREIYQYSQGEQEGGFRVREQRLSVRNLYKAFAMGKEVTVLKENFLKTLKDGGAPTPRQKGIKAEDLARQIATQALFHQSIVKSGTMDFKDRAGFYPDGLIDSVTVTFDPRNGIEEVLNFSNAWNAREQLHIPIQTKFSSKRRFEDDIIKDRIKELAVAAMRDRGLSVRAMTVMEAGLHEAGALYGSPVAGTAFGSRGIVSATPPASMPTAGIEPRSLVPIKTTKPKPPPEEEEEA